MNETTLAWLRIIGWGVIASLALFHTTMMVVTFTWVGIQCAMVQCGWVNGMTFVGIMLNSVVVFWTVLKVSDCVPSDTRLLTDFMWVTSAAVILEVLITASVFTGWYPPKVSTLLWMYLLPLAMVYVVLPRLSRDQREKENANNAPQW